MSDEKVLVEEYLSHFNNGVSDNVTVVSPQELGQRWLYHISTDPKIKQFIPALTRRTAMKEDRTVPRISVASSIIGCLIGYQGDIYDFMDSNSEDKWRDGWYIYGFENECSVTPSTKILYDAKLTDERWLVPYKADKWKYPAKLIGKFFYRQVAMEQQNKERVWNVEAIFEVSRGSEVRMMDGLSLTEGYWSVSFKRSVRDWKKAKADHVRQLTVAEWKSLKGLHANLLSFEEPPSKHW